MKFKFCSDGDCPLWALAGLHALGSLPAQLFRSLLQHVIEEQPCRHLGEKSILKTVAWLCYKRLSHHDGCPLCAFAGFHALGSLPAQLFRSLLQHVIEKQPDDGIMEILKDTSLSSREECARAAAVIRWVVQQALSCACPGSQLTRDLLVLGVPRAHAAALADATDSQREAHEAHVRSSGFVVNKVTDVVVTAGPEGAVDSYKLSLTADTFTGEHRRQELLLEQTQAKELLHQLKAAYKRLLELEVEQ